MSETVMIVDDDRAIRITVQQVLEEIGMEVLAVDSGQKCLQELRDGFQGVVLMDIMMPEMNGWDTIGNMVEEGLHEGMIICMLTAVNSPSPKLDRLKEYVLDYIRKPFTGEELIAGVEEACAYV